MKRIAFVVLWLAAGPAVAHHPGDRIDEVMAGKEPAFEATDATEPPELRVVTAGGQYLQLEEFADQIITLSFVRGGCGETCAAQQAALGEVRQNLEATPMREMVTFLTVRPSEDLPAGAGAGNRLVVAPGSGSVADQIDTYAALSSRHEDAPLVHIIDRGSRHAAIFHGSGFGPLNMTLYINGLTNAPAASDPGLLDRVLGIFW